MSDLKVCAKCGWYELRHHDRDVCDPEAGAVADALAAALPGIKSTKLGYGDLNIAFEFHDDCHVQVRVGPGGDGFHLESVWSPNCDHTAEDIAELVRAIASTKIGRGEAKR